LPVLLEGEKIHSLPPLLHARVFADFRNELDYFTAAFDLILTMYGIDFRESAVGNLRDLLRERNATGAP